MTGDVWQIDGATGAVLAQTVLPGRVQVRNADPAVRFSPDGARLAVGTANTNQLVVFETGTAKEIWSVKLENETAVGVTFAPDGKTTAVATSGGKVCLFDAAGKSADTLLTGTRAMTWLVDLGFTLQVPRPCHPGAADPPTRRRWKKTCARLRRLRKTHPKKVVEVWTQDEARLGLKPITRRAWALKGRRPRSCGRTRYRWVYVYGFVRPKTGHTFGVLLPPCEGRAHVRGPGPVRAPRGPKGREGAGGAGR
ncbi:dde endonuclease : Uncharacterized protein OS=Anabaena variabilis (strain ATCC 29413 / PCC 7937) GN=Ava_2181 PE=4 SV=1: PQQ_2 [Gemmata massiliana]|uniref:Anaphase-promoting complex subunit 4 WD40 domain-containing protein n=1 Tax=Gemmata massiliana TaxID=1210884 RepID=A0A6P2D274_9BACT|nr:hypothetical protein [Gemmata massiliana]VTR94184.1 dde endonuclease : Uncharacterized protein OS=Anabaena variabilis (strain ATCC 29413 / PCC 7937) GN=Ava_2181 PE=4 SV=1: PQQ_2 [Gemmata massiliana]